MYDGSKLATVGWTSAGQATRTSPAPERRAAPPNRAAAPAIPRPPATASTLPKSPLWLSGCRLGRTGSDSTRSSDIAVPPGSGRLGRGPPPRLAGASGDQAGDVPPLEARVDVH